MKKQLSDLRRDVGADAKSTEPDRGAGGPADRPRTAISSDCVITAATVTNYRHNRGGSTPGVTNVTVRPISK